MRAIHPEAVESCWMPPRFQRRFPSASSKMACDFAVVGGGLSGLSTALHLKRANAAARVVVLEKRFVGAGASGRSGGILVEHESVPGSLQDVAYLRRLVKECGIECAWRTSDGLLTGAAEEYDDDLLDPYRLVLGLAKSCARAGVRIFESSPVSEVRGRGAALLGRRFEVHSGLTVLATDSNTPSLGTFPGQLRIYAQPCLVARVPRAGRRTLPWTFYRKRSGGEYVWGRRLGSSCFLFGAEELAGSPARRNSNAANAQLLTALTTELPNLAGGRAVRGWTGWGAGFQRGGRRVVRSGPDGRLLFVGGYGGIGIAAAVRGGSVVASVVSGGAAPADFPVFDTLSIGRCG